MEVGEQATPFEHRSYGEELALCRRYCIALMDYGAGDVNKNRAYNADYTGGYSFVRLNYPQMRTEPDTVTYGTSATVDASDYSSNGLLQLLASSANWRIYDVLLESEL